MIIFRYIATLLIFIILLIHVHFIKIYYVFILYNIVTNLYIACYFVQPTEYIRKIKSVQLANGKTIPAWLYTYNFGTENLKPIVSGDFLKIKNTSTYWPWYFLIWMASSSLTITTGIKRATSC